MPFKIPSSQPLVIDGLLQNSEVKITTIEGTFIRHLYPRSGAVIGQQAFWDGKSHNGDYVSSGVYLCFAYTLEGKEIVEKIVVVRK
jgi:flagellar hook assembly protein FlgD